MPKRLKELASEATENQLATMIRESANQIWLAGLGAFSMAQKEGSKMFEALVAEGEKAQERAKVAADEQLAELREKATGMRRSVYARCEARQSHDLGLQVSRGVDHEISFSGAWWGRRAEGARAVA